jgi:hypothetical protein
MVVPTSLPALFFQGHLIDGSLKFILSLTKGSTPPFIYLAKLVD